MKRRVLSPSTVLILLLVLIFVNICFTEVHTYIRSYGTINHESTSLTVILRALGVAGMNPPLDIDAWVDNYVEEHTYGTQMAVNLGDLHIGMVMGWGYDWDTTHGKWGAWSFSQLKQFIDRFHYHGWKVGWETTLKAWYANREEPFGWNYLNNSHRELVYTYRSGKLHRLGGPDGSGAGDAGYDLFKNYTSDDLEHGIKAGERFLGVLTKRLTKMISDGLNFDYWFGTDGWNGLGNSLWAFIGSGNENAWVSASYQELDEYGNYTNFVPDTWGSMNNVERANWIAGNSTATYKWTWYWDMRWAQLYRQIKDAIAAANPGQPFYTIGTVDFSSWWSGGGLAPHGSYNFTLLADFEAIDYFYVDAEGAYDYPDNDLRKYAELGKQQAIVSALGKSKDPRNKMIIGLQLAYYGNSIPVWVCKQEYLAQAQNHVWFNGRRYGACEPNVVMIQYPCDPAWNNTAAHELFAWIRLMVNVFSQELTPVYLGPTFVLSYASDSYRGWSGFNYTLAQWVDVKNLKNQPNNIVADMGTLFISGFSLTQSGMVLEGVLDKILESFASGNPSIIFYSFGGQSTQEEFARAFGWGTLEEQKLDSNWRLLVQTTWGTSTMYNVLGAIMNPYAAWIAYGYENTQYDIGIYGSGRYKTLTGFVPIVNTADGYVAMGIYYNSTSGRFLYGKSWSRWDGTTDLIYLPRAMLNKAVYWATDSPINSSEPLLDLKIFKSSDGTILVPVMNHKDMGGSSLSYNGQPLFSVLQLNDTLLGLGNPSNYIMYWQSKLTPMPISDWSTLQITLNGMADVLVIKQIS